MINLNFYIFNEKRTSCKLSNQMRILAISVRILTFKTIKFLSQTKLIVSMKIWIRARKWANWSLLMPGIAIPYLMQYPMMMMMMMMIVITVLETLQVKVKFFHCFWPLIAVSLSNLLLFDLLCSRLNLCKEHLLHLFLKLLWHW